jgi:glutaredoxin
MYVNRGCPHCEAAEQFFKAQNVSVETVEIGFDPIIQAGVRSLTAGQNFQVPLIVSFATQEVVAGNDPVQLQRIVAALAPSTAASNVASV